MSKPAVAATRSERVFFALWPEANAVAQMMEWASAVHALCGGRPMRPETLHLTLAFLGNIPVSVAQDLAAQAGSWPARLGEINLCCFGRFTGPAIVWAGPEPGSGIDWLDTLYDDLWTRAEAFGILRPTTPFRPHVSLLRKAGPGDLATLAPPLMRWTPRRCALVASTPGPGGSHYRVLADLPVV